ncbi:E3 ubiquitin-protein ligase UBR1 [Thelohanellus kitauei]|uniref:E3 ubiquitin-protein ligase n=1 Tax=Thelohanellus kitauei TaxID=669202 RepID=A0A0C2MVT0_THEKT|nr:E3 ubiquitin-protein ligase UBR1 [Thelohanellus kitauei]
MEKMDGRINDIIINGLLKTLKKAVAGLKEARTCGVVIMKHLSDVDTDLSDTEIDLDDIYSSSSLKSLVIEPLTQYVFEGYGPELKERFNLESASLPICAESLREVNASYSCLDCQAHPLSVLCDSCFHNSEHMNHRYRVEKYAKGGSCDCGDSEAWKFHSSCTKHGTNMRSQPVLPEKFVKKLGFIIKYLCELLEKFISDDDSEFDNEIECMLDGYLETDSTGNTKHTYTPQKIKHIEERVNKSRKWCLLIVKDKFKASEHSDVDDNISIRTSKSEKPIIEDGVSSKGYSCVRHMVEWEECIEAQEHINLFRHTKKLGCPLKFRIIKVYRYYFMRLVKFLPKFIKTHSCNDSQLLDMLSDVVFQQTSLLHKYVFNEHSLWIGLRGNMLYRLFLPALSSDKWKIHVARFILENFEELCTHYLEDCNEQIYCFLNILVMFVPFPLVSYLVENGFLNKMLVVLSNMLKSLGVCRGANVTRLYARGNWISKKLLTRFLSLIDTLNVLLEVSLKGNEWSPQFRAEILRAGKSLSSVLFGHRRHTALCETPSGPLKTELKHDFVIFFFLKIQKLFRCW